MDKQQLFEKYKINEDNSMWNEQIDNWNSVEIYRHTHGGQLPPTEDTSINWVLEFLDEFENRPTEFVKKYQNWGSLYLTAKRMVYLFADEIIKQSEK